MQNVMLLMSYAGTNYHGWQKQPGQRTVQGVLEDCLKTIIKEFEKMKAAGRTDAGTHALGQVVNFHTSSGLAPEVIARGLNRLLPRDIVIRKATAVPEDFHARYSARSKLYLYVILNQPYPSPFYIDYSWHLPYQLNINHMKTAAQFLLGHHDFSSFRAASCNARTTTRTLVRLEIENRQGFILFWIEANAFLQHMVRNIVGTLVEVGRGRYPPEYLEELILAKDRTKAGPTAPAHGLFLYRVYY
jgi:tRNA pseudouridine38-40 synthase